MKMLANQEQMQKFCSDKRSFSAILWKIFSKKSFESKKVTVNSELRRFFDRPSSYWDRVFSESITVADDYEKKVLLDGYSLYNLEEDPFEIENLVGPDSENPEAYSEIIEEILDYIEEQKSKGHVLPPIPGDENGKLYTRIFQRMGPVYGFWFLKKGSLYLEVSQKPI